MTRTLLNPLPFLLLLLGVSAVLGLLLLASATPTVTLPQGPPAVVEELPPLTAHALRHEDAQEAFDWVSKHGRYCRYQCPDGRTRYVCGMSDHRWAVVVVEAARLVTAFTTDQDYAKGIVDTCHNPWRMAHP